MAKKDYVAHTPPDDDLNRWQTMREHAGNVANLAAGYASRFGAGELACWAGWLHDVGKYSDGFQCYLRDCHAAKVSKGTSPKPGSAEHKRAGTLLAWEMLPPLVKHILAPCVLGHHGGLHAAVDTEPTLREAKDDPQAEREMASAILRARVDLPELGGTPPSPADIPALASIPKGNEQGALHLEMLTRFVFSCLVDADGLDTEAHFNPSRAEMRRTPTLSEIGPRWLETLRVSQEALQASAPDTPVSRVRREVYGACLAAAEHAPGVFTLTVPTGGGKTRSSLAFALAHALRHNCSRIIYAIPYTSIIDQTASTFREILGNEGILEHHSAVDVRRADKEDKNAAQAEDAREQRRRMAAENWDAPLVVTTTVQFFESLFANRTSPCRKLHNIAGSVVILDEVQTLPPHLLTPLLDGMRALTEHYGVTLVLCTATQPAIVGKAPFFNGLPAATPIVLDPDPHFVALRRVTYRRPSEPWGWPRVAEEIRSRGGSSLTVLNTKKDALSVLRALDDPRTLHLSTLLCGDHRRYVLDVVRQSLATERHGGPPVHVVATQVIEAGVDVDFPCVLRAKGPLDRVIQAAGRCNREGSRPREDSDVVIFDPLEGAMPRGDYATSVAVAWKRLAEMGDDLDLDSPTVATDYFAEFYSYLDAHGLDQKQVQKARISRDFPLVAEKVRLIENDTVPVIVPYHRGKFPEARMTLKEYESLVDKIKFLQSQKLGVPRELWRKIQPINVAIYATEVKTRAMVLEELVPDQLYRWTGAYDSVVGIGDSVQADPSDYII